MLITAPFLIYSWFNLTLQVVVLDTDVIFASDIAELWRIFDQLTGKKVSTDFLFKGTGFVVQYFEVFISLFVSMHFRKKLVYYNNCRGGCYCMA